MKTALMISFLFLGQHYNLELAISQTEKATGLMYRTEWTEESQGMIFLHSKPQRVSYWMKNTYLKMSLMYLDSSFNILEHHHPTPLDIRGIVSKSENVQYVLELDPSLEKKTVQYWNDFKNNLKKQLDDKHNEISQIK